MPAICVAGASVANCELGVIGLVVDDPLTERLRHDLSCTRSSSSSRATSSWA
jgi:hypothetical protein